MRIAMTSVALGLLVGCGGGAGGGDDVVGDDDPVAPDARDEAPPDAAPPTPDATWPPGRVYPIYVAASDEPDADIAAHVATYDAIIAGIRGWYTDHLPGEPIAFHADPVRALRGHHTRAEWDYFGNNGFVYPDGTTTASDGGCSMYYGTLWELTDGGLLADAGLPPPGTPDVLYYAIAGGGANGSCGAGGYLGASELQLLIAAQGHCPQGRKIDGADDCSAVGAVGHELGHGFGLPHGADRPTCTDGPTLMDTWWLYDDGAKLCVEDRDDLRGSRWFAPL